MNKDLREFYKAHGICIDCGHNEALPGRTRCAECAEKNAEYARRRRENMTAEEKEKAKEEKSAWLKRTREARRSDGKCIYCGGKLSQNSNYCCLDCWVKYRKRYLNKQSRKIKRIERPAYGMCYRCGKPISGGTLCEDCREVSIKNLHHEAEKIEDGL